MNQPCSARHGWAKSRGSSSAAASFPPVGVGGSPAPCCVVGLRVHPPLLRHSVAQTLLERGMTLEQIQKFLGHAKLETTQIYAESSPGMIKASYQRALTG